MTRLRQNSDAKPDRPALADASDEPASLAQLGARIRQFRKAKGLSLVQISGTSGVSVAMLSHIERGKATPSLKVLDKLRSALGVSMVDLFPPSDGVDEARPSPVVRAQERRSLEFPEIGLTKQKLSPGEKSDLELLLLVIEPGGGSGPDPWARAGEKAGLVLAGAARLEIGEAVYELGVGDSFQFDASQPHRFDCIGDDTAEIVWIIKSNPIDRAVDA